MLAALKLGTEGQAFDALIRSVGEGLQKVPEGDVKNTLVQANAMFVEGSMAVLPAFSESLKSNFKSSAQEVRLNHPLSTFTFKVDYKHAAEEARKAINSWVEANTANKIKDLFPAGSIDATTRMVLANAIYFKGRLVNRLFSNKLNQGTWKEPFDRRGTSEADFYTLTEGVVKCQMMYDDSAYPYAYLEELNADAIKISFQL